MSQITSVTSGVPESAVQSLHAAEFSCRLLAAQVSAWFDIFPLGCTFRGVDMAGTLRLDVRTHQYQDIFRRCAVLAECIELPRFGTLGRHPKMAFGEVRGWHLKHMEASAQ